MPIHTSITRNSNDNAMSAATHFLEHSVFAGDGEMLKAAYAIVLPMLMAHIVAIEKHNYSRSSLIGK